MSIIDDDKPPSADRGQRSPYSRPTRRPLRIYALDPQRIDRGRAGQITPRATVYAPYEEVKPGPIGRRVRVIDYDGTHRRYYEPIDLDHPRVLIRDGLPPSETDPRFHQQMVYAVITRLWADFETALGRRIGLGSKSVLTVLPHAFYSRNAFYDSATGSIAFGYFQASETNPGDNLPGQMVFTCLSHDIICHETTHALIDRLRPLYMRDLNDDVKAFHEGFSDLIAIFQHFKMPEVLIPAITDSRGDIGRSDALLGLARQFGYSTGQGTALRSAQRTSDADVARDAETAALAYTSTYECHERGSILVRAVFEAFLSLYNQRTQDLIRLATEGTGVLREGALPPDLVGRLAQEASRLANEMFTSLVRSFDYLPAINVTFEDFLRALVTLDIALSPSDDSVRVAFIEGFRRYGIFPKSAGSMGDYAVAWQREIDIEPVPINKSLLQDVLIDLDDPHFESRDAGPPAVAEYAKVGRRRHQTEDATWSAWTRWTRELRAYGNEHAEELGFVSHCPVEVASCHVTLRQQANDRPRHDLVVLYVQDRPDLGDAFSGTPTAGTTLIAQGDGLVRYIVKKPLGAIVVDDTGATMLTADVAAYRQRVATLRAADAGSPYRSGDPSEVVKVRMTSMHSANDATQTAVFRSAAGLAAATSTDAFAVGRQTPMPQLADPEQLAAAVAAQEPTPPAPTGNLDITVKMYRVGFGDCFLITMTPLGLGDGSSKPFTMLFDCGRHSGSQPDAAEELDFEETVAGLFNDLELVDNRLDLLVVTHRHRDHVHGFSKFPERWKQLTIGEIWMPWIEDPTNRHAKDLQTKHEELARLTLSALKAFRSAAVSTDRKPAGMSRLDVGNGGVESSDGSPSSVDTNALDSAIEIVYNATSNAAAMRLLHSELTPERRRFLPRLGRFPDSFADDEIAFLPEGVKVHVIGPSRDPKVMMTLDPPSDAETFEPAADEHRASVDDGANVAGGVVPRPFGDQFDGSPEEYKLRRVEREMVEALAIDGSASPLEIAYRLDRAVNGTSLVIVIEAGDKKLLFPGDAQWGTWNAILEHPIARDLVSNTDLYKVGHHGSHNATPKHFVDRLMSPGKHRPTTSLVSVAKTKYSGGWQHIPLDTLLTALKDHGPVRQSDLDTPPGQASDDVVISATVIRALRDDRPAVAVESVVPQPKPKRISKKSGSKKQDRTENPS